MHREAKYSNFMYGRVGRLHNHLLDNFSKKNAHVLYGHKKSFLQSRKSLNLGIYVNHIKADLYVCSIKIIQSYA